MTNQIIDKLLVYVIIILLGKIESVFIMEQKIIELMALAIVELTEDKTGKETISVEDIINGFKNKAAVLC